MRETQKEIHEKSNSNMRPWEEVNICESHSQTVGLGNLVINYEKTILEHNVWSIGTYLWT